MDKHFPLLKNYVQNILNGEEMTIINKKGVVKCECRKSWLLFFFRKLLSILGVN